MSHILRNCIANNVKKYREKKKLKREELSLMLGLDNSYISKLEKGHINITVDKLEQIAFLLDVDTISLLARQN